MILALPPTPALPTASRVTRTRAAVAAAVPHLQPYEARVLALGLLEDGSGLLPHVWALLHSHQQNVGVVSLFSISPSSFSFGTTTRDIGGNA